MTEIAAHTQLFKSPPKASNVRIVSGAPQNLRLRPPFRWPFSFGAESIRKPYVVPPAACLSSFRQANRSGCSGVVRCILPNMRWLGCRVSHFRSWHMILVRWPERPFVQRPVRQPWPKFGHIRRRAQRDKQISICWLVRGCLRIRIRLSYFNGADCVHSIDQYP